MTDILIDFCSLFLHFQALTNQVNSFFKYLSFLNKFCLNSVLYSICSFANPPEFGVNFITFSSKSCFHAYEMKFLISITTKKRFKRIRERNFSFCVIKMLEIQRLISRFGNLLLFLKTLKL